MGLLTAPPPHGEDYQVLPMNWPAGLPSPGVTRHLWVAHSLLLHILTLTLSVTYHSPSDAALRSDT